MFEAQDTLGGLASSLTLPLAGAQAAGSLTFDAGPYVLLDKPGLERAFAQLGMSLEDIGRLHRLDPVYSVHSSEGGAPIVIAADLDETAASFESRWPGSGDAYRRFVRDTWRVHQDLRPMLEQSRPSPLSLLRMGAGKHIPFLLSSAGRILRRSGLPQKLQDALAIWTHIAGQDVDRAPSPLCMVPAICHRVGAYVPLGGTRAIAEALVRRARQLGVELRCQTKVRSIESQQGHASAVRCGDGQVVQGDVVISGVGAHATYDKLIPAAVSDRKLKAMRKLPLQSPGVCAYIAARSNDLKPHYLRFKLAGNGQLCRSLVDTGALQAASETVSEKTDASNGWRALRLIAPMRHAEAEAMSERDQERWLEELLAEPWWQGPYQDMRVLQLRTPASWGRHYSLYKNAMNPTMTASFMRRGRFPHSSPHLKSLYLCGSSTHPGQWMSFCALSGIIAADLALQELGRSQQGTRP